LSFYVTDPSGASDTIMTVLQVVSFLRGDLDLNNTYTMSDLADLIAYVYREGPEPQIWEAGDVNADGKVNLVDITYMIRFLYHGGPPPPAF
ncbi:MAG: dockerin type I repeat-containing protein, partial [Candidatus Zixiibacteriota bacterium]